MSVRPRTAPLLASAALAAGLAGCGAPEDPQLAMCQAIAKRLTGDTITGWERTEQDDGARGRRVSIAYTTVGDGSGSIDCAYPVDEDGTVATAPDRVDRDGVRVGQRELIAAGTSASREILAGTAAETAERTKVLAREASEAAREAAASAVGGAVEAGQALQERLER